MTPISERLTNYSPLIWVKRLLSPLEPLPTVRPCDSISHPEKNPTTHLTYNEPCSQPLRQAERQPGQKTEQCWCHHGNGQSDRGLCAYVISQLEEIGRSDNHSSLWDITRREGWYIEYINIFTSSSAFILNIKTHLKPHIFCGFIHVLITSVDSQYYQQDS